MQSEVRGFYGKNIHENRLTNLAAWAVDGTCVLVLTRCFPRRKVGGPRWASRQSPSCFSEAPASSAGTSRTGCVLLFKKKGKKIKRRTWYQHGINRTYKFTATEDPNFELRRMDPCFLELEREDPRLRKERSWEMILVTELMRETS